MAEVKILLEGYLTKDFGGTCSTITLISDKDIKMIIDPGTVKDQKLIIDQLANDGLTIEQINYVGITHSHMDHYRNIGMFKTAETIDYWGIWEKDTIKDWGEDPVNFSDDIQIIKTPGHSSDNITFLVKTAKGIVAICGDVFWQESYPQVDPYAYDSQKLAQSRQLVLEKADYIIPGHGKMFKVIR